MTFAKLASLSAFTALVGAAGVSQAAPDPTRTRFDSAMQPILTQYLAVQAALSSDSFGGVPATAATIQKAATKLDASGLRESAEASLSDVPAKLAQAAAALSKAANLTEARARFKELSKPIALWVSVAKPADLDVVYCSMAPGSWVQRRGPIRNPYFGSSMLACGEVVSSK